MSDVSVPTFDKFMNPLLQALRELGGSGTIDEMYNKVIEIANLSDEQLDVYHKPDKGGLSAVEYRLAWTRTYLKKYGLLENSRRGVWALTAEGKQVDRVNPTEVKRVVRQQARNSEASSDDSVLDEAEDEFTWREELLEALWSMDPSAFERLTQRILRESGFIQVEVTGKSGDGGIDGKGIMQLSGLLSFHVIFQCKRYQGSVSSGQIRDFRGAMVGRADKGLFITTGRFTKDAMAEATRDGAPPIDLIDGDQLIDILKELSLGVKTEIVATEKVTINKDWFANI